MSVPVHGSDHSKTFLAGVAGLREGRVTRLLGRRGPFASAFRVSAIASLLFL